MEKSPTRKFRKRLQNYNTAKRFAEKTNGVLHDNRGVKGARYRFTVSYEAIKPIKLDSNENYGLGVNSDWCPEDNRDFGYPNEYWE